MSQTWNLPITGGVSGDTISASRTKINDGFASLRSSFSGTSAPSSPVAGQLFFDTANNKLEIYDGSNWYEIASDVTLDGVGSILRDGSVAFTGDQSMGSNKLTNVADCASSGDAVSKGKADARTRLLSIYLGDISATQQCMVWCGGPACTWTKVSIATVTTISADGSHHWDINLYNHSDTGTNKFILASDFSTSDSALTADQTNDLGSFQTGNDELAANDCVEIRLTKTGSPTSLDQAVLCIAYKVAT